MRKLISKLDPSFPVVNSRGEMLDQFRIFVQQVEEGGLIIGTGTPEGSVEAQQGRFYMDDTGPVGAILYIKQQADIGGDNTKGWVTV